MPSEEATVTPGAAHQPSALPFHWYLFFGIIEPISVAAGSIYAVFFQEKYHSELIPMSYLLHSLTDGHGRPPSAAARAAAATAFSKADTLGPPTRMALSQLGSCYFLIMLNSAFVFFSLRRHLSHQPEVQEQILYYFFFVLGAADWTHILLTIHFLPAVNVSIAGPTPSSYAASPGSYLLGFASKVVFLLRHPSAWNSLLFGNIAITLFLFCARAMWWIGIGRDTLVNSRGSRTNKPLPLPPKSPLSKKAR